jgi:hypothetical protein
MEIEGIGRGSLSAILQVRWHSSSASKKPTFNSLAEVLFGLLANHLNQYDSSPLLHESTLPLHREEGRVQVGLGSSLWSMCTRVESPMLGVGN